MALIPGRRREYEHNKNQWEQILYPAESMGEAAVARGAERLALKPEDQR
jgi:hypothetical protein